MGEGALRRAEAWGREIDLDFIRRQPDWMARQLTKAGLAMQARTVREIGDRSAFPETTPQAFLMARKPGS